jgi:hypothetical protein
MPWSYLSHVHACRTARLFLAEDNGGGSGGDGGTPEPADDATGNTDHETPPELSPCPFFGHTDLDDSGEQIKCNGCQCVGPVAGSGMDKYGAWNARGDSAPGEDPAPDDAPPADPAAHAASVKTLADAKKLIVADAAKAQRVHAGFKQAVAAHKKAEALNATLAASNKEALAEVGTVKAELATEKQAHADYKAGEPKRVNAAALRIAQSQGNIPPVKVTPDTNANAGRKPAAASNLTGLARATAAHTAARTK